MKQEHIIRGFAIGLMAADLAFAAGSAIDFNKGVATNDQYRKATSFVELAATSAVGWGITGIYKNASKKES